MLSELEQSRDSVAAFAARHGIDPQRLYSWRRRLGSVSSPQFVEIHARQPSPTGGAIEVVCPSGHVVRASAATLDLLGPVLRIVEGSC